jgi:hypothetical protein
MRYDKHNFVQNLSNATRMGDHDAAKQMLLSQLADIILMHSDLVISDLKNIGVDVPSNPSSKELAKLSIEHLDDPKFQKLIAETIIHHQEVHGLSAVGQFDSIVSLGGEDLNYNADGEGKFLNAVDPVSAIADAAGELFKFGGKFAGKKADKQIAEENTKAAKEQSKQELIKLLNTKQEGKNANKNIKHVMSPFAILGIVIGSIIVIGAISYTVYKMKNKKAI